MGCFEKIKYRDLPHHIKIITGADWETKSNHAIEDELEEGFILLETSCSAVQSDSSYGFDGVLVLVFEKQKGGERSGDNKNTNTTGNYDSEK